jgi:hypothetical protein
VHDEPWRSSTTHARSPRAHHFCPGTSILIRAIAAATTFITIRAVKLAATMCAVLVPAAGAQGPTISSAWEHISYPTVKIPGSATEELMFMVSSGNFGSVPSRASSQLSFSLTWGTIVGVPMPASIANERDIVVRLHTEDGKVIEPRSPFGWTGIGGGIGINGGIGMSWTHLSLFPWSRNALDEAWIELRMPGQTWWVELPYGFARNPVDPEIPDRTRGEPRFPRTMLPLGANDILVPWLAADYGLGISPDGMALSVKLSNAFVGCASVRLNLQSQNSTRMTLDAPRIGVSIEAGGDTVTGRDLARRLHDSRLRTDEFSYGMGMNIGRSFGTFTVAIDGQRYGVRVPSSLFESEHGRTRP